MKTLLLRMNLILIMMIGFSVLVQAQRKKQKQEDRDTQAWRYEIEAVNTGVQGTYLIKVWSYSSSPNAAIEQSKKNAVHGIMFKGFNGSQGVPGQKALCPDPNSEIANEDFFRPFFSDGGKYMKFVNITNDGAVAAQDIIRIGKEYKIGLIVSVNVAALRKDLEDAGIIKSLSNGF
ncbi:MAG: hypothetical protein HXX14_05280 [Bacteroidetes bacterium]|nr:hypothetical protein [Bacteroidota bacterium]